MIDALLGAEVGVGVGVKIGISISLGGEGARRSPNGPSGNPIFCSARADSSVEGTNDGSHAHGGGSGVLRVRINGYGGTTTRLGRVASTITITMPTMPTSAPTLIPTAVGVRNAESSVGRKEGSLIVSPRVSYEAPSTFFLRWTEIRF